jgi:tetratricopeptide (TPR) repeat protein/DNA-binding XRE family transcriptional regulator
MAATPPRPFGAELKRLRLANGLTQAALAERAGLSLRVISDLERGVIRTPHQDTLQLLTAALQLAQAERASFEAAARWHGTSGTRLSPGGRPPCPHSPLTGRTHEIAQLQRHLVGEGPPLLLLAGEPGIGKTRLLEEAVQDAVQRGWRVLEGGCHRRSGQEPYAPLVSALGQYLQQQAPTQSRADLEGCSWLVRLLPELAEVGLTPLPTWTVAPEQERRLLFAAVGRFLQNVAGPAGTLLVLDDLHWAGTDALDLLASLLHAPLEAPLRVIGAYRSTEVYPPDPLGLVVADLAVRGLVALQRVGPLSPAEARALLGVLLAEEPVTDRWEQIVTRTGGVPFFLVSCAQALQAERAEEQPAEVVPWNVAESIRQRVALLPQAAKELLGVAAIVGRRLPRALLVAVARALGQSPKDAVLALEAASQAQLVLEEGEAAYQFAHDLIREAVLAELSAARRALLHQLVAEALEQAPGELPVERLAYHYSQAGVVEQAVRYLERAGDHAWALHATTEAEGYYRDLLADLEQLGRPLETARTCEKLGKVLMRLARYDDAQVVLERALEIYRLAGEHESLWHVLALLGHAMARRGDPQGPLARLLPLVANADPTVPPSPGLADLYTILGILYFRSARFEEGQAAAERAVELASVVGDDALLVRALHALALVILERGRVKAAFPVVERLMHLAERVGDLWYLAHALDFLSALLMKTGAMDQCQRASDRAVAVAEQVGDPAQTLQLYLNRGRCAFLTGNWKEARLDYERATHLKGQAHQHYGAHYDLLSLGELCLAEGQWEIASEQLTEGIRLAERSNDFVGLWFGAHCLAEWELLEGHPETARARLAPHLKEQGDVWPAALLAWAELDLGREDQAEAWLAQSQQWAISTQDRLATVEALRIQARLAMRQQRWSEAQGALEEALGLTLGQPYEEAKTRYVSGVVAAQHGEPVLARERLEAALAILQRLGERLYAKQVEQALISLKHSG